MSGKIYNVVSVSGGKDSTALALLALEREPENVKFVFADTGHEHPLTVEYVEYLSEELRRRSGVGIITVRADFRQALDRKKEVVATKWRKDGIPEEKVLSVLKALNDHKPGNPFLDLCMAKGRFPSPINRFCSHELKGRVIDQFVDPILEDCEALISWRGVRADESKKRSQMLEKDVEFGFWEPEPTGHLIYRPILKWTVEDVFAMHDKHGVKHNPLYEMGMSRVGCMPCIHARKTELRAIATRCPEELDRTAEWEKKVAEVSRSSSMGTFFACSKTPHLVGVDEKKDLERSTIASVKEWALTSRGGRQFDLLTWLEGEDEEGPTSCSSVYGLCE